MSSDIDAWLAAKTNRFTEDYGQLFNEFVQQSLLAKQIVPRPPSVAHMITCAEVACPSISLNTYHSPKRISHSVLNPIEKTCFHRLC